MSFFTDPEGNLFSTERVGGVKAVSSGFVVLGSGVDEVLSYTETPPEVAIEWRDALNQLLLNGHRSRRCQDIDWLALAARVAPDWATSNGYVPAILVLPRRNSLWE